MLARWVFWLLVVLGWGMAQGVDRVALCREQGLFLGGSVNRFGTHRYERACPGPGVVEAQAVMAAKDGVVAFGRLWDGQEYKDRHIQPFTVEPGEIRTVVVVYKFEPFYPPQPPEGGGGAGGSSAAGGGCGFAYGSTCLVLAGTTLLTGAVITGVVGGLLGGGAVAAAAAPALAVVVGLGVALMGVGLVLGHLLGEGARQEIENVFEAVGQAIGEVLNAVASAIGAVVEAVVGFFEGLLNGGSGGEGSGNTEGSSGSGGGSSEGGNEPTEGGDQSPLTP